MRRSKKRPKRCPVCGSRDVLLQDTFDDGIDLYVCADCDHEFEVGHTRSKRRGSDFDYEDEFERDVVGSEWD
jgi:DNA-directed RNA polymerase subunit RPC12/RpoP